MCYKFIMLELFIVDKVRDSYGLVIAVGCVSDGDLRRYFRGLYFRCFFEGGDL